MQRLRAADVYQIADAILEEEEATMQQQRKQHVEDVHVISSDEENLSNSDDDDDEFAGFPSSNSTQSSNCSNKKILKRRSQVSSQNSDDAEDREIVQRVPDLNKKNNKAYKNSTNWVDDDEDEDMRTADGQANSAAVSATPVKRIKLLNADDDTAGSAARLPNSPLMPATAEQIVEVNSNSTTKSQKAQRLQRNSKLRQMHLNFNQRTAHAALNNNHKCSSSESSSEFPVSSPSNPQRPKILKNTLPADAFERKLASIASSNPQMTLEEKMNAWQCESNTSDVEDVNEFDSLFKQHEEKKRKHLKAKNMDNYEMADFEFSITETENYDFQQFFSMMLKQVNTTQLDLSTLPIHAAGQYYYVDRDKPSTSSAAYATLQKKLKNVVERCETTRKRQLKQNAAANMGKNSTTPPPATSSSSSSSSENDEFAHSLAAAGVKKKKLLPNTPKLMPPHKVLVYEKVLCPTSSSEEASQDVAMTDDKLKSMQETQQQQQQQQNIKQTERAPQPTNTNTTTSKASSNNNNEHAASRAANEHVKECESVFRLYRLNREIDKKSARDLLQMHFKLMNEKQDLRDKKHALFKTPNVPQKYMLNQTQQALLPDPIISSGSNGISTATANKYSTTTLKPSSSISLHNVEDTQMTTHTINHNKNESPFLSKTLVPHENGGGGVAGAAAFHQQHEFCNYLGLTGMSTANAVANAVAELANCNLARRSLRVRHLQHQQEQQKKKFLSEEKAFDGALRTRTSYELKQRQKGGGIVSQDFTANNFLQETSSTDQQPTTTDNVQSATDSASNLTTQLTNSSPKVSEIKILYHLETNEAKRDAENLALKALNKNNNTKSRHVRAANTVSSNDDTSTCPRSSHSYGNADDNEETSSVPTEKPNQSIAEENSPQTQVKLEPISARSQNSSTQSTCSNYQQQQLQQHQQEEEEEEQSLVRYHTAIAAAAVNKPKYVQNIHEKFKKYLEESRQSKPSIYIVQCLDSKQNNDASTSISTAITAMQTQNKMKTTGTETMSPTEREMQRKLKTNKSINVNLSHKNAATLTTSTKATSTTTSIEALSPQAIKSKPLQLKKQRTNNASKTKLITKKKSKDRLHKLLTRSTHNSNQRQLRTRNVIVLKSIKQAAKRKAKGTFLAQQPVEHVGIKTGSSKNIVSAETAPTTTIPQPPSPTTPIIAAVSLNTKSTINLLAKSAVNDDANDGSSKSSSRMDCVKPEVSEVQLTASSKEPKTNPKAAYKFKNQTKKYATRKSTLSRTVFTVAGKTQVLSKAKLCNAATASSIQLHKKNAAKMSSTSAISPTTTTTKTGVAKHKKTKEKFKHFFCVDSVDTQTDLRTKDRATQSHLSFMQHLYTRPGNRLQLNPLKGNNGRVIHIYYEMDILIVVQENYISFWKYSKLLNILAGQKLKKSTHNQYTYSKQSHNNNNSSNKQHQQQDQQQQKETAATNENAAAAAAAEAAAETGNWTELAECRRLQYDIEVPTPYENRICIHNSMPIYVEMRCREVPREQRDCNLLSVYINVYYYHDEEMQAKMHSIQLDAVQSLPCNVIYTTILESRYFIMSWPQENILGKVRSGLCKYSLTPQLDTLASIREFKSMRHEIRYLECSSDDKLLGFGDTQFTIWDHRSGDIIMNYDLTIEIGRNLGSVYYPSLEIGHNNMILLFQYTMNKLEKPVLRVIACSISHSLPSHRVLHCNILPASFNKISGAVCTGEQLLITAANDKEVWINCSDPTVMTFVPPQNTRRFYTRGRSQVIELTNKTLTVDTFANHLLKLTPGNGHKGYNSLKNIASTLI